MESRGEEGEANIEDIPVPSTSQQHLLQPSSHNPFQKKETCNLLHVLDSVGGDMTVEGDPRRHLMSTLSQSSTSSQSRSSSSHQVGVEVQKLSRLEICNNTF